MNIPHKARSTCSSVYVGVDTGSLASVHPSTNSKAKRCIDVAGALVGLSLTTIVFIPIAIAIYSQ